jgi:D-serine dehydratase
MFDDLQLPALILRDSALAANINAMADWCRRNGFEIAPHGKTTMCPQIFRRQMDAGAWGITVATTAQAQVAAGAGIERILIANQVIGAGNVRALSGCRQAELYCLVDSVEAVDQLATATRPLNVLLEVGKTGWRTGVRSADVIDAILRRLPKHCTFRGVEAFEGLAKDAGEADAFLATVLDIAESLLDRTAIDKPIFSVGGSSYLGPVARAFRSLRPNWKRLLRSGCYVTHDHGIYAQQQSTALAADPTLPRFVPALELWACVQSVPDPGRAIIAFGKRNCAYDISLPTSLDLPGATITTVNDQHAYLSYPEATKLRVGDRLRFGISHPCTAFDKWREIPLVDDDYRIIDIYRTCF